MRKKDSNSDTLYLIYDDECPMCRNSAHAINIKKAVGNLVLINARESHPLIDASYKRGFDPNRGIIVIYNAQYYFGADAVCFLAMLNTPNGFVNKCLASLFSVKLAAKILYPIVKSIRRTLLALKGVGAIQQNHGLPLFSHVFGDDWEKLSPFMKKRFGNRPYSNDEVVANGKMTLKSSRWMQFIKPLLKISGALIQQDGEDIPIIVKFRSDINTAKYWFDRQFQFESPIFFKSYMLNVEDNILVEFMRFNVGWRAKFSVNDGAVLMSHYGYVLKVFGLYVPVPIGLLLGKCNVVERHISCDAFSMEMNLNHFLFGKIYEYKGVFTIAENVNE